MNDVRLTIHPGTEPWTVASWQHGVRYRLLRERIESDDDAVREALARRDLVRPAPPDDWLRPER